MYPQIYDWQEKRKIFESITMLRTPTSFKYLSTSTNKFAKVNAPVTLQ